MNGGGRNFVEKSGSEVDKSGRSSGTSSSNTPNRLSTKIPVEGARRVWGTLKVTTTNAVKSVICSVASLKFKRKTVCDNAGQLKRWWFVMHGSEDALQILDGKWDQIQAHTCWKLEQCFRPFTEEGTSTSQPFDLQPSSVTPAEKSSPPTTTGPETCNTCSVEELSDSQSTPALAVPFLVK